MKVIIASHQKTGTKTLNAALKLLDYSVYDFLENFFLLQKKWAKIVYGSGNTNDFKEMYENVDAVCDLPCLLYWEEIHKAFPDSKIILCVRDEESWYKSLVGQLKSNNQNWSLRLVFLLSPSVWRAAGICTFICQMAYGMTGTMFNPKITEINAKLCYRRHNAHVLQNAPEDKLLVYRVKDGWAPLCQFLGREIPEVPFPHKNKRGDIFDELLESNAVLAKLKREAYCVAAVLIATFGVAVFGLLKYYNIC